MIRDVVEEQKKVTRRFTINCLICGSSLVCPHDDFWAWAKCGDVLDFRKEHRQHAPANAVGHQIEVIEKD